MNRSEAMAIWQLVSDKDFVREVASSLDAETLPRGPVRWIAQHVKELWEQDRSLLTMHALGLAIEEENFEQWGTTKEEVVEIYGDVVDDFMDASDDDLQKRRNTARKWLREQALKSRLDAATEAQEAGDLDAAERELQKAATAGKNRSEMTFDNAFIPMEKPAIRTGIKKLDKWWRGGAHEGQLCCVLAPSNQGKSMILPHFAGEALRVGKNVIYYTTELPEGEVYRRVVGAILREPLPGLDAMEAGKRVQARLRSRQVGDEDERSHLSIRYRDPGTITTTDIMSDLDEKAEQGIRIHMVILDGDDIGVGGQERWEKMYDQYFHIYKQLSSLATQRQIVVWTAAQATRDSFKKPYIKAWHTGDSLWKYRKSDLMIAMNSTDKMKDQENERPFLVVSVAKDRYYGSKDRHFNLQPLYGKGEPGIVGYEEMEGEDDDDE